MKQDKKIVIWGAGSEAIRFVLLHNKNEFSFCIDSYKRNEKEFLGMPLYSPEEAKRYSIDFIVVATSENAYQEIRALLIKEGKKEFRDFGYYSFYKKKVAVLYGNCFTGPIKEGLRTNERFNKEYGIYPLPYIHVLANKNELVDASILKNCDLFIHQSVRKENEFGEKYSSIHLIQSLRKGCNIIAIPNLNRMPTCFFPNNNFVDGGGNFIEGMSYFPFRDSFIDQRYMGGGSSKDILYAINEEDIIERGKIRKALDLFINKVAKREKGWDIHISDWIIENYRKKQLFYDGNHPTEYVVNYVCNKLIEALGFSGGVVYEYSTKMDALEVPIYGQVKRELGLNYSSDVMRRYSGNSLSRSPITTYEYVDQYIKWNLEWNHNRDDNNG